VFPLSSIPSSQYEEELLLSYEKAIMEEEEAKKETRNYLEMKRSMRERDAQERKIEEEKRREREEVRLRKTFEEEKERKRKAEEEARRREQLLRESEEKRRIENAELMQQQLETWLNLSLYTDSQAIRASPHLRSLYVSLIPLMATSSITPRVGGQAVVLLGKDEKRFETFRQLIQLQIPESVSLCISSAPSLPSSVDEGLSLAVNISMLMEKYTQLEVAVLMYSKWKYQNFLIIFFFVGDICCFSDKVRANAFSIFRGISVLTANGI
jgi:hypothetical protein